MFLYQVAIIYPLPASILLLTPNNLIMHPILMITLLPNLPRPPLQIRRIPGLIALLIMKRHNPRRIRKQIIHLLQWQILGLRQHQVEEQRVGEVADDEDVVVSVGYVLHGHPGYLPDERVEGEGDHGRDGDTFGAGPRVEDLGWNDPRKRTASGGEGEVIEPCHHDEAPGGGVVVI